VFLISNFRRVLNVVCFLLGNSSALNFVCQRFGTHCLFHLHRRVGMKNDWGRECWGICTACFSTRTRPYPVTLLSIGSGYFRAKPFPVQMPQHSQPQSFFIPTRLWRRNRVFRNVGTQNSDAGELRRRKHTTLFLVVLKCAVHTSYLNCYT
jgi:hypothetical protein